MAFAPATSRHPNTPASLAGWRTLALHYLEMLLAMLAGMLVIGMVRDALGLTVPFADQPGASYLLMATDMSLAMAAWMRYRGHSWAATFEMCAAMYVPAALVPLVWLDLMSAMTFMVAAHTVMLLAMLAALLHRRHECSRGRPRKRIDAT